jgi:hypothetical protein
MCLTTIGGQKVMLSQKRIDAWKNAIGAKGRKMVDGEVPGDVSGLRGRRGGDG